MRIFYLVIITILLFGTTVPVRAQEKPLTQAEYVQLLYTLQKNPQKKDEIVETVRRRGIGFVLTEGLKSLTASKSGNDVTLRRTLEEAARRKENPAASQLPGEKESSEVLAKARTAALAAINEMPDFIVRQVVIRSIGYAGTNKFTSLDRLLVAVGYRPSTGREEYRLLSVNGIPQSQSKEKNSYAEAGGSISTGEFVNELATIFKPETETKFQIVDTDVIRGRRALVYSFDIDRDKGKQRLGVSGIVVKQTLAGERGKIWIDRDNYRVLRIESQNTQIPDDFPMRASSLIMEYDWVTINDQKYLLPTYSDVRMTVRERSELIETRNEIRFRDYRKFDVDIKLLDEEEPVEEEAPPKKP